MNLESRKDLFAFSIRHTIIEHPAYVEAIKKIELLHQRSKAANVAGGLLITGHTGSGKSTIKTQFAERYPRVEENERTLVRVLVVDTPSTPTVKSLVTAMLVALGDPASLKGTAEEKTERLYTLIKGCGVEILLIDEFQHYLDRAKTNEIYVATDWLKNLINRVNIPVVLIGLPRSASVLELNEQLRRRFSSRYSLDPFSFKYTDDIQHFRGVLRAIEEQLPINSISISSPEMAERFYFATYGLIDYIAKIVDGAVQIAVLKQLKNLDLKVFEQAFYETVWGECSAELNPFSPDFRKRNLTLRAEPFSFVTEETSYQTSRKVKEK